MFANVASQNPSTSLMHIFITPINPPNPSKPSRTREQEKGVVLGEKEKKRDPNKKDKSTSVGFAMARTDEPPVGLRAGSHEEIPPGRPMSTEQHLLDKEAQMLQSLKPIKQMSQHVCTFALYNYDMNRQIETHHYVTRINQDFLQCAVYDSDDSKGHLIGVEYIISDRLFENLDPEEQKLWHSHTYEIKSGFWVNPRVPEMVVRPELENLAKSYGKFWCTWQTDRGDKLPLGPPALMMSPQPVNLGMVKPGLVQKRDDKYNISTEAIKTTRVEISEPEWINPQADHWKQHGKCFVVDVQPVEMKRMAPFP